MQLLSLDHARPQEGRIASAWALGAFSGRLTELSSLGPSSRLSMAANLLWEAQQQGEPVAWVGWRGESYYPIDLAACGVGLASLCTIRLSDPKKIPRAAEHLARSGAFGLIVADLPAKAAIPAAMISRLSGLAQKHGTAVVFLSEKSDRDPSFSSLISLRLKANKRRVRPGRFTCEAIALKDKRRGPGWLHEESYRGPAGMR